MAIPFMSCGQCGLMVVLCLSDRGWRQETIGDDSSWKVE